MDLQKIKTLIDLVGRSRVSELSVSEGGTTVVIRNAASASASSAVSVALTAAPPADEPVSAAPQPEPAGANLVRSPVAGIVHRSNSPGAAPLVEAGDTVEAGQGLCIIEAMKVFTTVPASFGGVVRRVLFTDGEEVEAGHPLVEIE